MAGQFLLAWRSQTAANMPAISDEDLAADVDEPPDLSFTPEQHAEFHKSIIRSTPERKQSLLTKALLHGPEVTASRPEILLPTDLTRRRSTMSNASQASTAELTSDGGLTSPARTNTPSPPLPTSTYTTLAPYSLSAAMGNPQLPKVKAIAEKKHLTPAPTSVPSIAASNCVPLAEPAPRKRCITFACGGRKDAATSKPVVSPSVKAAPKSPAEPPKRVCSIKFACAAPKPTAHAPKSEKLSSPPAKPMESKRSNSGRSSSCGRKARLTPPTSSRIQRDSSTVSTVRNASQSPRTQRTKPKYLVVDENTLNSTVANRFHEFASEEVEEDDWIRQAAEEHKTRLTINDTLKKENAIRRLGNEAEEEALEEDNEDDEEDQDDSDFDEEDEEDEEEENDFSEGSDGNETDNEAGFADSDEESDGEGDFAFWTISKSAISKSVDAASRPKPHRASSISSIDSLGHMGPAVEDEPRQRKPKRSRRIKIRPGTPDLPDSTDFVCGTLDEDRPLEDAYVSCMEARKREHHQIRPQDIDPSFPTSDLDDEDENDADDVAATNDSDEPVWLHGKFEESDSERPSRRHPTRERLQSPPPKRYRSPPPHAAKARLRPPPPRRLFGGQSPKLARSPPLRTIYSPPGSPTTSTTHRATSFAPLGSRPGLTYAKSLPRAPNPFCRAYTASRLESVNGNGMTDSDADGHVRGAIDIVKGLEQKRQRRKEKFFQKQCARARKCHPERKPQPGKGAERMRELGLTMAGKVGTHNPYMLSA